MVFTSQIWAFPLYVCLVRSIYVFRTLCSAGGPPSQGVAVGDPRPHSPGPSRAAPPRPIPQDTLQMAPDFPNPLAYYVDIVIQATQELGNPHLYKMIHLYSTLSISPYEE